MPLVGSRVAAGFPSPADDYLEHPLDFNELLIANHAATFAVRVAGESMIGARIFPGDIAVVDRSLTAADGAIILGNRDYVASMERLFASLSSPEHVGIRTMSRKRGGDPECSI